VQEAFLLAAFSLLVAGFIDLVDGSVARYTGKVSMRGAYLDTIVDRYVEGIVAFGLLFASLPGFLIPAYGWVFLYFFGALMTTYAKASAKEKGLGEIKGGLLERAERILVLFLGIVLAIFEPAYLTYAVVLLAVLSNVSALQRIGKGLRAPLGG